MPIYMKIEGIDGDSTSVHHRNWFDIHSFSWGESNAPRVGGSGGGAGKVSMQDFHFTMSAGKASPQLFLHCANGRYLSAVQFEITRQINEGEMLFERFSMEDCLVTIFEIGGDGGGQPIETLSLNFTKLEFRQFYQNPNGSTQSHAAYWDIKRNQGGMLP